MSTVRTSIFSSTGCFFRYLFVIAILLMKMLPTALAQTVETPRVAQGNALASRMQTAGATDVGRRVLALYYPWYRTLQYSRIWSHHDGVDLNNKRINSHSHYPLNGPYDSNDPAVIDRHLEQAEAAGIDTLVCSWWGATDPTDRALRLLLLRAAKRNIKVCVLWEQVGRTSSIRTPASDLTYLLETFGKQPAYLRVNERPVVFAFDRVCRAYSGDVWASTLNDLKSRLAPGVLLIGTGQSQADLLLWDGLYDLGSTVQMSGRSPAECARLLLQQAEPTLLLSKPLKRICIVSLAPGYDDRKPNATSAVPNHTLIERQEGKLYSALWQQAIAAEPDWILINSFNQWHTGTEIEPSVEMGDTYLKLTRQFATQFKKQ